MSAHPHAALMMQYAQDAIMENDPWLLWEERIDLGVSSLGMFTNWVTLKKDPDWNRYHQYRRKPRTININGYEVPEPMRGEPESGSVYWITRIGVIIQEPLTSPEHITARGPFTWVGSEFDRMCIDLGIAHTHIDYATRHAKALLSFTKQENGNG